MKIKEGIPFLYKSTVGSVWFSYFCGLLGKFLGFSKILSAIMTMHFRWIHNNVTLWRVWLCKKGVFYLHYNRRSKLRFFLLLLPCLRFYSVVLSSSWCKTKIMYGSIVLVICMVNDDFIWVINLNLLVDCMKLVNGFLLGRCKKW